MIKDLKTGEWLTVYDPKKLTAFNLLLDTVEVYDQGNGDTYRFRIGDAILAGIQVRETKTLTEFAEERTIPEWFELEIESDGN
jgi:hypothetical protein